MEDRVAVSIGTIGDCLLIISFQSRTAERSDESTISIGSGADIGMHLIRGTARDNEDLVFSHSFAESGACFLICDRLSRYLLRQQRANDCW